MATMQTIWHGKKVRHSIWHASGPPYANRAAGLKAAALGLNLIPKTITLDHREIINPYPMNGLLIENGIVVARSNIDLISPLPISEWEDICKECKDRYPDVLWVASIMAKPHRDAWWETGDRMLRAGADGLEANFGCPHGMNERGQGAAVGQDPELIHQLGGYVAEVAKHYGVPAYLKLTPNVTDFEDCVKAVYDAGCHVTAINTVRGLIVTSDTSELSPGVDGTGDTCLCGISATAVLPVGYGAIAQCGMVKRRNPLYAQYEAAAAGGISKAQHLINYAKLGAHAFQICSAFMRPPGYDLLPQLLEETLAFMEANGIDSFDQIRGSLLPHVRDQHSDVVKGWQAARATS